MSPLSSDPEARKRQLSNLRTTTVPGAGLRQAQAANVIHGGRARTFRPEVHGPVAAEIAEALAEDAPLRDDDGGLPRHDRAAVELTAVALLNARRLSAYLELHGDVDPGTREPRPAVEQLSRAASTAFKMLGQLGMTPAGRARLGLDLVRAEASLAERLSDDR